MSQDLKDLLIRVVNDVRVIHLSNLTNLKCMCLIICQIYTNKVDFKQNKTKTNFIHFGQLV